MKTYPFVLTLVLLQQSCVFTTSDVANDVSEALDEINLQDRFTNGSIERLFKRAKLHKAPPKSQRQVNRVIESAALDLIAVVAAVVAVSNPVTGTAIAVGAILLPYILDQLKRDKSTLWQRLEGKIEMKIGEKMAQYHVERLNAEVFTLLDRRIQKKDRFNADDLEDILDRQAMVFPQNYASLGWYYDLPLPILQYLPYMITAYHKLIQEGKQPNCALANQMEVYRAKVITAMKEMTRKRFRKVRSKSWRRKWTSHECTYLSKKVFINSSAEKCFSRDRLVTYTDLLTRKTFTLRKRGKKILHPGWYSKINKIRDRTVNFLWKEIVQKINKFYKPSICLENLGCQCPDEITKEEIVSDWPSECFSDTRCQHPCGRFGESYQWCYTGESSSSYIKCNRVDLDECMPVSNSYVDNLNDLQ